MSLQHQPKNHLRVKLDLAFLGLAIAVFTWGLQYKLSRYYPAHTVERKIPEAKLLTEKEPASKPQNIAGAARSPSIEPAPLHLIHTLALFLPAPAKQAAASRAYRLENCRWLLSHPPFLDVNFFRPPPAHLNSI